MPRVLKIHPDDSVAVALEPLAKGTDIPAFGLTLRDDVPQAESRGGAVKIEDDGSGAQKILDFLVERKLV